MAYVVVPSDINVLENKKKTGRKAVGMAESFGLMTSLPLFQRAYTRPSATDMRAVLTKQYDAASQDPAVEVCIARQNAISRQVRAHNYAVAGIGAFGGLSLWSFRKYDWKTKLSFVPLMAYMGSIVGRYAGDVIVGRHAETYRDRFLAGLPAKAYLNNGEE